MVKGVPRPRILVVDDDLGPRESLRGLLTSDYDIRTAAHGRAALAELRRYRPDLVLLDIKMPGVSGLDVLRRVKDRDPTIEVVMMTAYASMETVKQALTHGAFEYLIKPFSRRDLEDVVRRALLRRQQEAGAVSQLSVLRTMSRALADQLDGRALTAAVTRQLGAALGYDLVRIVDEVDAAPPSDHAAAVPIRDAEGPLGTLIVDNQASGRVIEPRERELLEILAEYLAVALRNARLSGQITEARRTVEQLMAAAGDAIVRDAVGQREREQRLHQSEKLAALGQLAEGIAHDFNNLLQVILGYTQLMKQNPGNVEFVTRSLGVVETAAIDGSETVRRIQQFARPRPEEALVPVDVNAVVNDAVALARPRWEEKQARDQRPRQLAMKLGDVPPINGRPAALTEAMTTLILNAMDAMAEGGALTITTGRDRDGAVVVRVHASDASGAGPGLAMADSIVKQHGGQIEVESRPGDGTTWTLCFAGTPPSPTAPHAPSRPGRVLLVDDDPTVREALAEILTRAGHAVTSVASGPAALAAFAPGQLDAVVTNIGMADMNGWELAERLRAADPGVSILFVTGWALRDEERARMERLGISRCLVKPVRPDELDAAVRESLSRGRSNSA